MTPVALRCPRCHFNNRADALVCQRCTLRPFTWLGDPFGTQEVVHPAPPAGSRGGRSYPVGKIVLVALVAYGLSARLSPLAALLFGAPIALVLWRWRRIGWAAYLPLVVGALFVSNLTQQSFPRSANPPAAVAPRPAPTPFTAKSQATASAVSASAAFETGQRRWWQADFEGAVTELSRAISLRPDWPTAHNLRALALVGAGRYDEALQDAETAVRLERSIRYLDTRGYVNLSYLDTRGYVHLKRGEHSAALGDYDAVFASQQAPSSHNYLGRGLTRLALGDVTQGRTDIEAGLARVGQTRSDPQLTDLETAARQALQRLGAGLSGWNQRGLL